MGGVLAATAVQGATSFTLTQLLSKEAQRLIAEMRVKVQAHVSRLPVSYYDSNKTGSLVSRIMNDVEGVRNLIGTGLVEFAGGLLRAVLALGVLLSINATMTLITAASVARVHVHPEPRVHHDAADLPGARARSTPRSPAGSPNRSARCAR